MWWHATLSSLSHTWLTLILLSYRNHCHRAFEPWHDKTNNVAVRPAKTQISLGIRPVWSESLLSAWRKLGSLATHKAHSEDSDQPGLRLIWVFAGCTLILLVLSCRHSFRLAPDLGQMTQHIKVDLLILCRSVFPHFTKWNYLLPAGVILFIFTFTLCCRELFHFLWKFLGNHKEFLEIGREFNFPLISKIISKTLPKLYFWTENGRLAQSFECFDFL